jgi:hypothetical protein
VLSSFQQRKKKADGPCAPLAIQVWSGGGGGQSGGIAQAIDCRGWKVRVLPLPLLSLREKRIFFVATLSHNISLGLYLFTARWASLVVQKSPSCASLKK